MSICKSYKNLCFLCIHFWDKLASVMISFVKKIVRSDEKLYYVARLHVIHVIQGALWFLLLFLAGRYLDQYLFSLLSHKNHPVVIDLLFTRFVLPPYTFTLFLSLIGIIVLLTLTFKYLSTEVGLTNQRIIYKTGLIMVDVDEVDIEEVRGEDIDHGILGSILNYARIRLDCRFIDDMMFPAISQPYKFVEKLNKLRERLDEKRQIKTRDEETIGL